jgi:hypothetical protein
MTNEIIQGKVAPLHPDCVPWWPDNESQWRWWLNNSDLVICPTVKTTVTEHVTVNMDAIHGYEDKHEHKHAAVESEPSIWLRLQWVCKRSCLWQVYQFILVWPLIVFVSWLIWGGNGYNDYPVPQILNGVCSVLGVIVTMPVWAVICLTDIGDRLARS